MPETVARSTLSYHSPPLPMPGEPTPQRTHSQTANLVSPAHASGKQYPQEFILDW